MRPLRFLGLAATCTLLTFLSTSAQTQSSGSTPAQTKTVAKPMTEKQKKKNDEKLRKELETPWRKWLDEDVAYIITDEEKKTFKGLKTDDERESFVESFRLRRDPTPDTEENEYREEHYRRIAYANEHFASGIPGWKTDRGRVYIEYGAADEVESHPAGGSYERPYEEGGGETSTYPFEKWRYRYIEGMGNNIILEFVDTTMSGEYRLTMDPSEKDALLYVPNAGLTLMEQMGLACKNDRFTRTDGTHLGTGSQPLPDSMNEFNRLEQYAKIFRPPAIKYTDLESIVTSNIKYNLLPMKVRADYIPVTGSSSLTNVTLQFERKDLQFKQKDTLSTASVHVYGRVTSMTGKPITYFEEDLEVPIPTEMLEKAIGGSDIYQRSLLLKPGRYRLSVAAKDTVGGNTTSYTMALDVPHMEDDVLSASSLILADQIEPVATRNIGTGQFVIGPVKVRPRMDNTFKRSEKLGIYVQFYNFEVDEQTKKPLGEIEYEVEKKGPNGTKQVVVPAYGEDIAKLPGGASQITVQKMLPLTDFAPGDYTVNIKAIDKKRNTTYTRSANFTIS